MRRRDTLRILLFHSAAYRHLRSRPAYIWRQYTISWCRLYEESCFIF